MRGKHGNHVKGDRHYRWNKKRITSTDGYVKIRAGHAHPLADPNGYVYEHLMVWISAGREAPPAGYLLHHSNDDKTDNRIENLKMMSRADHNALHNAERGRDELGRFKRRQA